MNCKYTEKVSALIDGELSEREVNSLKAHIASCILCTRAKEDFLFFRSQIKGLAIDHQTAAQARTHIFSRRIAIPAPVFGIAVVLFFGLIAALLRLGTGASESTALIGPPDQTVSSRDSLSRFDRGGKAMIFKEAR